MSKYHSTKEEYARETAMINNQIEFLEKWINKLKSSDHFIDKHNAFRAIQGIAKRGEEITWGRLG
tara:strand:+ start:476 stop:670 length:195 start_codon:yes stop_codon:yes gene_type:complete